MNEMFPEQPIADIASEGATVVRFPIARTMVNAYLSAVDAEVPYICDGLPVPEEVYVQIEQAHEALSSLQDPEDAMDAVDDLLGRRTPQATFAAADLIGSYIMDGVLPLAEVAEPITEFLLSQEEHLKAAGLRALKAARNRLVQPDGTVDEVGQRRLSRTLAACGLDCIVE